MADCFVCGKPVAPDNDGKVRVEGVTQNGRMWVWGPEVVHDPCRLYLKTPFDDLDGFVPTHERREI